MSDDGFVPRHEYEAFTRSIADRFTDFHGTLRDHFSEDDRHFADIKNYVNKLESKIDKLSDSTIAVAQSQNRVELLLAESTKVRRAETIADDKKRTTRMATFALVVSILVPVLTIILHHFGLS